MNQEEAIDACLASLKEKVNQYDATEHVNILWMLFHALLTHLSVEEINKVAAGKMKWYPEGIPLEIGLRK